MDSFEEGNELINLACAEYKKEFGEDVQLEDGDGFVTIFNLIIAFYLLKRKTEI